MSGIFQWTAGYAVGHRQIDGEHQRLFALAEEMHQAMLEGRGKQHLTDLLESLLAYTNSHFAHEERLMEQAGYPDLVPHRLQHEALRRQLRALRGRSAAGEVTMTIEVMQFVMDWLKHHIANSDRRIAAFLGGREPPGEPNL